MNTTKKKKAKKSRRIGDRGAVSSKRPSANMLPTRAKQRHQLQRKDSNKALIRQEQTSTQPIDDIEELLHSHAKKASILADQVTQIEHELLSFAVNREHTAYLDGAIVLAEKLEKVRSRIVAEIQRTRLLAKADNRSSPTIQVMVQNTGAAVVVGDKDE